MPTIADAAMDAAGVSTALTSAWYGPSNVMISNDEVASFVAESGGRLVGVGSADIRKPIEAVREIRRCEEELGLKAIRILPWLWSLPPTDSVFTLFMWHVAKWACRSVPKSVIPDR